MKLKFRPLLLLVAIFGFATGCASYSDATLPRNWTIEELDKYFIETGLAEGVQEGLKGGAPGQVIEIWT